MKDDSGNVDASEPLSQEQRQKIISDFTDFEFFDMSDEAYEVTLSSLNSYPDELLKRLRESQLDNVPGFGLVMLGITRGTKADEVNEQLCFFRELDDCVYYTAYHLVTSLHHYDQLPDSRDYSRESEEVRSQCSALIMVEKSCIDMGHDDDAVFDHSKGEYVLKDQRLVELVMAHSDKAVLLSDFIRSHRTLDMEILTEFMNGEAKALGAGLL